MKPTIPEVVPLVREFKSRPGNNIGGSLHIVLEDGNFEACHTECCLERAKERGDYAAVALARILLQMSKTQRKKLSAMF